MNKNRQKYSTNSLSVIFINIILNFPICDCLTKMDIILGYQLIVGLLKVLLAFYIAFIYCACVFLIATVGVHKDKCLHHKTTHTQHHHDGLLWPSLADATDLFFCFRPNCYKKRNNNNSKLEREAFSGKVGSIPSGFYFWVVMVQVFVDTQKQVIWDTKMSWGYELNHGKE